LTINITRLLILRVESNNFTVLPKKLPQLNLKEFSLDWLKYCSPPRSKTLIGENLRKFMQVVMEDPRIESVISKLSN
jgi:hypothetical protein